MVSGKPYSLVEIFGGSQRIIVPDLQRDYCWGTVNGLAENFTCSLIELFDEGKGSYQQCSLGLIYAYESPVNFVNIADGQQRLTSLYLLLCVLSRRLEGGHAKKLAEQFLTLDSGKEVREPRLRYEVRESTFYFMKDFINHAVLSGTGDFGELCKSSWFRTEYAFDPSVENMIEAVKRMERVLKKKEWKADQIANFVTFLLGIAPASKDMERRVNIVRDTTHDNASLSRFFSGYSGICFIYFDVVKRDFGEQMYVIINTRGTPMEPSEHLKAILIKAENEDAHEGLAKEWEDWQDFFWKNRGTNLSSDDGFDMFLQNVVISELLLDTVARNKSREFCEQLSADSNLIERVRSLKFETVRRHFKAFAWIINTQLGYGKENAWVHGEMEINLKLLLLPLLRYGVELRKTDIDTSDEADKRFARFFFNISRKVNISKSPHEHLYDALTVTRTLFKLGWNREVTEILSYPELPSAILDEEERLKLDILLKAGNTREAIETAFVEAEDHEWNKGEIKHLIQLSNGDCGFLLDHFKIVISRLQEISKNENRLLLRTLLVQYPECWSTRNWPDGWVVRWLKSWHDIVRSKFFAGMLTDWKSLQDRYKSYVESAKRLLNTTDATPSEQDKLQLWSIVIYAAGKNWFQAEGEGKERVAISPEKEQGKLFSSRFHHLRGSDFRSSYTKYVDELPNAEVLLGKEVQKIA